MKSQIIIALLGGAFLGAGIMYLVQKDASDGVSSNSAQNGRGSNDIEVTNNIQAETARFLEALDTSDINLVGFDPVSIDSVTKWVEYFRAFNLNLVQHNEQIEPVYWGKGVTPEHNGHDVTCRVGSWYIDKGDFNRMFSDDLVGGFKIYPAMRKVRVQDTSAIGGTFSHMGMTLVFTPTDAGGITLVDSDNVMRAFEYVDPCPKICRDSPSRDLVTMSKIDLDSCN